MATLWLDLETYSEADLSVTGVHRYLEKGAYPILFAYAVDDARATVWQCETEPMPDDLRDALRDASTVVAHNAAFDRNVLEYHGLIARDLSRWRCSMSIALSLSLPASLDRLGREMNLSVDDAKIADGKRLVRKFTRPRKPSKANPSTRWTWENAPEDWDRFVEYARMDVEAMRACMRRMPDYNFEPKVWAFDQEMNDRGFAIDIDLCRSAIAIADVEEARLVEAMSQATDDVVTKPTQVARIRGWLDSRGVRLPDMTRDTLEAWISRPGLTEDVRAVIRARLEYSRATVAKYRTLLAGTSRDRRARGCFQYSGAGQTMRWAGRRFQPQNLLRAIDGIPGPEAAQSLLCAAGSHEALTLLWHPHPPLDVIAAAVRGLLVAAGGRVLHVWDLSQIEARITAWFAGCEALLEAFADPTRDPYREAAIAIGAGDHRQLGKALVLACGFGMGWMVFQATAAKAPYFVELSDDEAESYVRDWRKAYPEIPQLWRDVERLAKQALTQRTRLRHRRTGMEFAHEVHANRTCLTIRLPSGHRLVYWDAALSSGSIVYTRYDGKGAIPRCSIWGGGFVENIVQATARHIMASALLRTEHLSDTVVVGTVHDEGIAEGNESTAAEDFARMGEAFHHVPSWAEGLPLAAEGYTTTRYRK